MSERGGRAVVALSAGAVVLAALPPGGLPACYESFHDLIVSWSALAHPIGACLMNPPVEGPRRR